MKTLIATFLLSLVVPQLPAGELKQLTNLPYGDHPPKVQHDNNGRMSIGAVLYDLAGNKQAAEFCVRMTLASR